MARYVVLKRVISKPVLQSAGDAGRHARRVPVHAHHGAEGLESEGMRHTLRSGERVF